MLYPQRYESYNYFHLQFSFNVCIERIIPEIMAPFHDEKYFNENLNNFLMLMKADIEVTGSERNSLPL